MIDFKVGKSGNVGELAIHGELTLPHATEFKSALMKLLKKHKSAVIHLEEVTDVDLSALQLLCSAHRTFIRSKKQLELNSSWPEVFERAVKDAGYTRQGGCPEDCDNSCFWVKGEKNE